MNSTDKQVTEKFAAFEKEQDPTLALEALDLIEAAERDVPLDDTAARKAALAQRLRFFAALDRHIDPTWDVNKVPVKDVIPPETNGVVFPFHEVDPSTIADPVARAQYERTLKANKDYAKWYDVQDQLRRIDERSMRFVELFLSERYTDSPADRSELEELLSATPLSDVRKAQLQALMPGGK